MVCHFFGNFSVFVDDIPAISKQLLLALFILGCENIEANRSLTGARSWTASSKKLHQQTKQTTKHTQLTIFQSKRNAGSSLEHIKSSQQTQQYWNMTAGSQQNQTKQTKLNQPNQPKPTLPTNLPGGFSLSLSLWEALRSCGSIWSHPSRATNWRCTGPARWRRGRSLWWRNGDMSRSRERLWKEFLRVLKSSFFRVSKSIKFCFLGWCLIALASTTRRPFMEDVKDFCWAIW